MGILEVMAHHETVAATDDGGSGAIGLIFGLALIVLTIIAMWKVFTKANKPGWAALIPIYNIIVMLQIVGRPIWWVFLFLIPIVNIVVSIVVAIDMAKTFSKGTAFGVFGLWLFSPIGYYILAFGKATYKGPLANAAAPTKPSVPSKPTAAA